MTSNRPQIGLDTDVLIGLAQLDGFELLARIDRFQFLTTDANVMEAESCRVALEAAVERGTIQVVSLTTWDEVAALGNEALSADAGEAVLLTYARTRGIYVLTNDGSARRVASNGVPPVHTGSIEDIFLWAIDLEIMAEDSVLRAAEKLALAGQMQPFDGDPAVLRELVIQPRHVPALAAS